ncbi:MAG: phospholipase C, partial [Terriglobia bacterium]
MSHRRLSISTAGFAVFLLLQLPVATRAQASPTPNQRAIAEYRIKPSKEPKLSPQQMAALLRQKIKYVFVLYQENRSFDSYFGTFPGAEGFFSHWPKPPAGFYQPLFNVNGTTGVIHPFRIGPKQFAADTDDVDHSHRALVAKMHIEGGVPKMDRYAVAEERKSNEAGNPSLRAKQMGELTMAYEDCDTIPLLWRYAARFVLFDHIFQEMIGPSTLGNISIIAAQTGQTQWALHPNEAAKNGLGVPVLGDDDPFWGSQLDPTPQADKMPVNPRDSYYGIEYGTQINLTFASLPLTLWGKQLKSITEADRDPQRDLADVKNDVNFISRRKRPPVAFGWYQEGYGKGPYDPDDGPLDAYGLHASYVTHHNGPQYFGYVSNNPQMRQQLHGLQDFFTALDRKTLPKAGGVFFVKGGFQNILHLKPADPDPAVQKNFQGDDDHEGYSDAQISEALVAETVNKIAASPYWAQSVIIITWDDSEGSYDQAPPPIRAKGPDGSPITDGPRVPLIFISPYARTQYVAHDEGNQASVVKFIDGVFNLPPLALLPDEMRGRLLGEKEFAEKELGPQDAITPGVADLISAFSPARLLGHAGPLPRNYVEIPESLVLHLPAETGYGCKT